MSSTLLPPDRRASSRLRVVTEGSRTGSARAGRPTRGDRARREPARTVGRPSSPRRPGGRPPRRRAGRALASSRRRLRIGVVVMTLLLFALAARLTQLQGFSAANYARQAERQRTQVVNLPAVRGEITDRDGATLAEDVDARSVYADPSLVDDQAVTAAKLSPLVGLPAATIEQKLADRKLRFAYIARGLTPDVGNRVEALELKGVGVLPERRRVYPNGTVASNVVGYTKFGDKDLLQGNGGIEFAYDSVLRGQDGTRRLQTDPAGREIPSAPSSEKAPVEGKDLRLTLDEDIQWDAQQAIAAGVAQTQADAGTIVIMNPSTGDILAMADAPDFDPNNVGQANPAALGNLATGYAYEPGSVNKIITMAAALDRGEITDTTPVTVPADIRRGGVTIRDAEPHGTLQLTAAGVLAHSSNIGAVLISEKVGSAGLEATMRAFGLGRPTGLDFPGESGGQLASSSTWSASQAATVSYGQGMSATALQMATVYATIANGGVRMTPRLVDAVGSSSGAMVPTPRAPGVRVVSARTASTLSDMLEQVTTSNGTGPAAAVPGYRVAGKTGTAYRIDPTCGCYRGYVSSFIGFAPADHPRVVIAVVLDNPKTSYFGGTSAAPVFQKVMTFALATLGVPPSSAAAPSLPLTQPGIADQPDILGPGDVPVSPPTPATPTPGQGAQTGPSAGASSPPAAQPGATRAPPAAG
ncbi:penicillin-binding protein 2 [Frankia sp. AgB1.9]|uniref:peptidoglycan D,D-transpeptidase FtsI family protein n=1 Tax=unclassified Frankia TaxID=2632575 RepID=UPI001933D93E|nr:MULTISPECIES: penicillin-binding protein 2 [unclassified Frankia]MBL7546780.1 penicillin-binding protein 2 [Frankia sp. AgB1.9]MBL7623573.1 penicillin-binding protein 2 [Frankia sp. AgB1.8]